MLNNPVTLESLKAGLEKIKALEAGWFDGIGCSFPADKIDWLISFFDNEFPTDLPLPLASPWTNQKVILEWSIGLFPESHVVFIGDDIVVDCDEFTTKNDSFSLKDELSRNQFFSWLRTSLDIAND